MKLSGFGDLYRKFILAGGTPQYVHPTGTQVAGKIGHSQKWAKTGPKMTQNFQHLLN